jgi:UDP-glucose 4-epimerase
MKKQTILVTGGAGFIGSNLCEKLVTTEKYNVYSLDNYSTGSTLNHVAGVTYIIGDTNNIFGLIDFKPDYIYHLGEYSRVEQSFEDIEKVWQQNTQGTFAVLQFCRHSGAKLIYAGSSTKFGDDGLGRNQSPYAWTKATNSELVINFGKWYNIKYSIVYFYNAYGNKEIASGRYATLIAIYKEKYRNGEPLTVVSPGTQQRNFTHIDDIIDGLIKVGENGEGDGYGIGSAESYSILEIANMFGGEITMIPQRKGNRMSAKVVTEKTQMLGWKARKTIKEHIDEFKKTIKQTNK